MASLTPNRGEICKTVRVAPSLAIWIARFACALVGAVVAPMSMVLLLFVCVVSLCLPRFLPLYRKFWILHIFFGNVYTDY